MTHPHEYKMALTPLQQQAATLAFEVKTLEAEIINLAKAFNPAKPDVRLQIIIEGKMFDMKSKTDELLRINLNVFKTRI